MSANPKQLQLAIFFGGPSNERNISLDTARNFFDSIRYFFQERHIHLIFISKTQAFYRLSPTFIYSNTIEDFEASLTSKLTFKAIEKLFNTIDIFIPLIHGSFGEDGQLSHLIRKAGRKSILGSGKTALALTFNKHKTKQSMRQAGFLVAKELLVDKKLWQQKNLAFKKEIFKQATTKLCLSGKKKIIVKPNTGGSSDGVSLLNTKAFPEFDAAMHKCFRYSSSALIEEYIQGKEFSIILTEDSKGKALAFPATEIKLQKKQGEKELIYSRQKKYMPESGVRHTTPADFPLKKLREISRQAEQLFRNFKLEDWARLDGFLRPNGEIIWNEINGIPGYGQDGLIFQQSIVLGLHAWQLSLHLLSLAWAKESKPGKQKTLPIKTLEFNTHQLQNKDSKNVSKQAAKPSIKTIAVLGGGESAERQVSRMSWFNVLEKLQNQDKYKLLALFMDTKKQIWHIPRILSFLHTSEEIEDFLYKPERLKKIRLYIKHFYSERNPSFLGSEANSSPEEIFQPYIIPFRKLREISIPHGKSYTLDFLFIALHGGIGENGDLQKKLENLSLPYNGSDAKTSRMLNDKFLAQQSFAKAKIHGMQGIRSLSLSLKEIEKKIISYGINQRNLTRLKNTIRVSFDAFCRQEPKLLQEFQHASRHFFQAIKSQLDSPKGVVIKPRRDGSSVGVWIFKDIPEPSHTSRQVSEASELFSLSLYTLSALAGLQRIPYSLFSPTSNIEEGERWLEMPMHLPAKQENCFVFEEFIGGADTFELTLGIVEKKGKLSALLPSKVLASDRVLSLDEKFHKGMGTNVTPPKEFSVQQILSIQKRVEKLAKSLNLRHYARIDLFYNQKQDTLYPIEVNTLPALTAATVLYTQALLTKSFQKKPTDFLSHIIEIGLL